MAQYLMVIAALCLAVSGAPPAPPRMYTHHAPAQLQQINPLAYYLDNQEVAGYYNQAHQKQGGERNSPGALSRLETLEPDSEVELIPGAQLPQQPPQQTPVSPNLPGLLPGQRVYIVHMPVPGYRPGTIGGYQPVYIVAAAPQGNTGYPGNGYQNAVFVDHSGQVVPPLVGYPRGVGVAPQANPSLVLGAPLTLNRPSEFVYQDSNAVYQQTPTQRGTIRLSQLIGIQSQPINPVNTSRNEAAPIEPKRLAPINASVEEKEAKDESLRSPRPAQTRQA